MVKIITLTTFSVWLVKDVLIRRFYRGGWDVSCYKHMPNIFVNDMASGLHKGGVGRFEKPARDTLFVIFHGMLLTS